jgi:transcriptional regulator with XRE-family HTH domain
MTTADTQERNDALRAARLSMGLSQDRFAGAIVKAGDRIGQRNSCSKRNVQRWERGEVTEVTGPMALAIEDVVGVPVENLGLTRRNVIVMAGASAASVALPRAAGTATGPLTGIWLSQYWYVSSGRGGKTYTSAHYCLILQRGASLDLRSLPKTATGSLTMDLSVKDRIVSGNWTEHTDPESYYHGARYFGTIQMTLSATNDRMRGQWLGFNKEYDVQNGPWTLRLVTHDTGNDSLASYDRPVPEDEQVGEPPGPLGP